MGSGDLQIGKASPTPPPIQFPTNGWPIIEMHRVQHQNRSLFTMTILIPFPARKGLGDGRWRVNMPGPTLQKNATAT